MTTHPLARSLAAFLVLTLVAPSAFLLVPQKTYAQTSVVEVGRSLIESIATTYESTISAIKNTLTSIHTYTSMIAEQALVFNAYVLQPLAFVMSGNLLKTLTAGVIQFVVGATNGTGAPQFVQDLQGHMQIVGDSRALAFFVQFGRNSNSPFAAAISSSLRTNYLQNTSMAGFWAANRSTLPSNINLFLAGNWAQGGGTASWFALTTQSQNNPYLLYQASQSQLTSLVANATAARLSELNWGQGFLSWCGAASDSAAPADSGSGTASDPAPTDSGSGTAGDQTSADSSGGATGASSLVGTAPGDACTDSNGHAGTVKTPGSTIKATLDKVLGANQDKLVQLGQLANEVGSILGNVGTVLQTVNFASQILGGSSGGLFGVGQASASGARSQLMQYQSAPGYIGATPSTVYQNAATLPGSGSDATTRISEYESAWNTIRSSADAASVAVTDLANFCTAAAEAATLSSSSSSQQTQAFINASRAQADTARATLTTVIGPVIARADAARTTIATARAFVTKVQSQLTSGSSNASTADLQTLQTMPPTTLDSAQAQQDAQPLGTSVASPPGSLNVSGGSLVNQMNLVSTNAAGLKTSVCTLGAQNSSTNTQGSD